jgi:hypothetical protein
LNAKRRRLHHFETFERGAQERQMRTFSALGIAIGAWFGAEHSAAARVNIDIDLSRQRMHVVSESGANYNWPISSGRPGHVTPRGLFAPQQMYKMVYSWKYGNTPMPHAIFFYGNFAIHGTDAVGMLGHVASHGCVRLSEQNAATLYGLVEREGARIAISGGASSQGVAVNPHKAGHRLAFEQRRRMKDQALGYAPGERLRTLKEWVKNPVRSH